MLYQRLVMVAVALAVTLILIVKGRQPAKLAGLKALSVSPSLGVTIQISGDVAHPAFIRLATQI